MTQLAPDEPARREPARATGRVAVVVATRDRADALEATLERLGALPERPRVIVVDNASEDRTAAVARAAGERVRLVRLRENAGAAARNVGARLVREPYVAFADDDSWWAPGALELAARAFDEHPRLALVAGRVIVEPDGRDDPTTRAMARSPLPRDPALPGPRVLGFVACGAVVRRSAFLAVGGFREGFGVGGEEDVLALDLASAGWSLAYLEDVVAHHAPASAPSGRGDRRSTMVRNELWSAWMRRRAPSALRVSLAAARLAIADRDARRGLAEALRGAPRALGARRPVPRSLERELRLLGR